MVLSIPILGNLHVIFAAPTIGRSVVSVIKSKNFAQKKPTVNHYEDHSTPRYLPIVSMILSDPSSQLQWICGPTTPDSDVPIIPICTSCIHWIYEVMVVKTPYKSIHRREGSHQKLHGTFHRYIPSRHAHPPQDVRFVADIEVFCPTCGHFFPKHHRRMAKIITRLKRT